jgi:TolB protein
LLLAFAEPAAATFPGRNGLMAVDATGTIEPGLRVRLVTERSDGTDVTTIRTHGYSFSPAWTADGHWLAFVNVSPSTPGSRLMLERPDGSHPQVVHKWSDALIQDVSWSPNGRRMAISTLDHRILVIRRDGTGLTRLTRSRLGAWHPSWSPGGGWIAYERDVRGQRSLISVMRPDGSGRRALVTVGRNLEPGWSPDGRWLVFSRLDSWHGGSKDSDLFVVRRDGAKLRQLTRTRRLSESWGAFSPNGIKVAFIRSRAPHVTEPADLWVIGANGSHPHRVRRTSDLVERRPDWQPW